jgi:hypothetical protein
MPKLGQNLAKYRSSLGKKILLYSHLDEFVCYQDV